MGENSNPQNLLVRTWMQQALLRLLASKKLHTISVTELTRTAGVSRVTFYRNYSDLSDILFDYLQMQEFGLKKNPALKQYLPRFIWSYFDFFSNHRELFQCIQENCDFISLAGFTTNVKIPEVTGILLSDKTMINRIFTNLFSNILKYGDKGTPVIVRSSVRKQRFTVTVSNAIKQEHSDVGSSNIGLRNVQRMMQMMDGEMLLTKKTSSDSPGNHNISQNTSSAFASENVSGVFEVTLWFPLR